MREAQLSKYLGDDNMTILKKAILGISILSISTALTFLSTYYQTMHQALVGRGCPKTVHNWRGYCYEDLPAGGLPFPMLFDNANTATKGTLGFDDTIHKFMFIADFVVITFLVVLVFLGIHLLLNRNKEA